MDLNAVGRDVNAMIKAGRREDAEQLCLRVLKEVDPQHRAARYSLGTLRLAKGDWTGWQLYEARRELAETGIRGPAVAYPEWDGRNVGSLLVWGEQGHGDQIMLARYLPVLRSRGISVTLLCRPALVTLLEPLADRVLPMAGTFSVSRHDAWVLMGSLPAKLGPVSASPYLAGGSGGGVGVMASGDRAHPNDASRSLPANLADELRGLGLDLDPGSTHAATFAETADIIQKLRLVITVDTGVAHLAAAMGKPTWILLAEPSEWRWGWTGASTPWYPTARLFRQPKPGDWSSVLQEVRASLASE